MLQRLAQEAASREGGPKPAVPRESGRKTFLPFVS
jgi:hypothetical protein